MKWALLLLASIVVCGQVTAHTVAATATSDFKLQILPLECSLDTVALGYSTLQQVGPASCLAPSPQLADGSSLQIRGASSLDTPLSERSYESFVSGTKKLYATKAHPNSKENVVEPPLHPLLIGVSALVAAGLPDVVYAIHGSASYRLRLMRLRRR